MKILVIAEHDHNQLKASTFSTIAAANALQGEIEVMIIGSECQDAAEEAAKIKPVSRVIVANHPVYAHQLAENSAELIMKIARGYHYLLGPATTFGKNLLPRVAALLDVSMVSDVIKILDEATFLRPIYAGNIIATVKSEEPIKVLSIRTTAFSAVNEKNESPLEVEELTDAIPNHLTQFEGASLTTSTRPELTNAKIIIAGGRGLKSADNFHLLEAIADRLKGAVGASRAAVDAGFAPNDYQVGQTGKIVAPDLYIAIGISGAIQHLAGMKESKVIVAINNDPDAPIFEVADYGLVGDLFKILPALNEELDASHKK